MEVAPRHLVFSQTGTENALMFEDTKTEVVLLQVNCSQDLHNTISSANKNSYISTMFFIKFANLIILLFELLICGY